MNPESEAAVNVFLEQHNSHCRVIKGYGLTEMSSNAVFPRNNECNKIGSVGTPLVENTLKIIDSSNGAELGYNEIGEICLTGPTLIDGYWQNEEENRRVFKSENGVRWIHTGDRGYMDEDGVVFFSDRVKRMIVRHDGFKVYPSKIEAVIIRSSKVENCCVIGISDRFHMQGMLPFVYVVLKPEFLLEKAAAKKEIELLCKNELPEYSQPYNIEFINSLPLTSFGKVDYRALEETAKKETHE